MKTKFGNAEINSKGYYRITSSKEGNCHKLLHRLIFEECNGLIPKGYDIHHIDGNKLNNNIENLEMLPHEEHMALHSIGRTRSIETRKKISKANKGRLIGKNNPMYHKTHTEEAVLKIKKANWLSNTLTVQRLVLAMHLKNKGLSMEKSTNILGYKSCGGLGNFFMRRGIKWSELP